jgi:hypothetical protein
LSIGASCQLCQYVRQSLAGDEAIPAGARAIRDDSVNDAPTLPLGTVSEIGQLADGEG